MTMKTINLCFVSVLQKPWAGLGDCDGDEPYLEPFRDLDTDNEQQMRAMIRQLVVPEISQLNDEARRRVKEALAYSLSVSNGAFNFERFMQSDLPPFRVPTQPRRYFEWCWQECFPGEAYQIADADSWKPVYNANETFEVLYGSG